MSQTSVAVRRSRRASAVAGAVATDIMLAIILFFVLIDWGIAGQIQEMTVQYALGLFGLPLLMVVPWIVCSRVFRDNPLPQPKHAKPNGWIRP